MTNSIARSSHYYGDGWPSSGLVIPQGLSTGGWTRQSRGYPQQTFLGASIRSFNMQAGFGDTSSTLTVDMVVDEFNKSDGTKLGLGDDVYHSGEHDSFMAPFVGSPVFFKFGRDFATVTDAFQTAYDVAFSVSGITNSGITWTEGGNAYDSIDQITSLSSGEFFNLETSGIDTVVIDENIGRLHTTFGGILQSYIQNKSPNGEPVYTVQVVDPREILSNVKLILNNYAGTTFESDNIYNVFGFLEHNLTRTQTSEMVSTFGPASKLERLVDTSGNVSFSGTDTFTGDGENGLISTNPDPSGSQQSDFFGPDKFPMTGTGFSRRSDQGMPYYRINQAIRALMERDVDLPKVFKTTKYGDKINFRGFKYVVDLEGLPKLPAFYYIDYDEMNLMDLCLEICEATNHDLFVNLLPIIDRPEVQKTYDDNIQAMNDTVTVVGDDEEEEKELVAGLIKVTAIDRSKPPDIGAVQKYLNDLDVQGIVVEQKDLGYELSNVTTEKFILGGQETNMHLFSTQADRGMYARNRRGEGDGGEPLGTQWDLLNSLKQQLVPYYGTLSDGVVSIPKGYGSYQQILLDTTSLFANGVGDYYVATEMELRCALISYEKWVQFLMEYNDKYLESVEEDDLIEGNAVEGTAPSDLPDGLGDKDLVISNNYAVTVPRCVWPTYSSSGVSKFGEDDLPTSACHPPYGYPLYYKRATKLGIPQAGLAKLSYTWNSQILPKITKLKANKDGENYQTLLSDGWTDFKKDIFQDSNGNTDPLLSSFLGYVENAVSGYATDVAINIIEDRVSDINKAAASFPSMSRKATANAKKVHSHLKNIASECLGKKFLVKLPHKTSKYFNYNIENDGGMHMSGPYGFNRVTPSGRDYQNNQQDAGAGKKNSAWMQDFLEPVRAAGNSGVDVNHKSNYNGAANSNYDSIDDTIRFNYLPSAQGGFFNHNLMEEIMPLTLVNSGLPSGMQQLLIPNDLKHFVNDNGRISCYVRFDNSQDLSFAGINPSHFSQQVISDLPEGSEIVDVIPDIAEQLDNLEESSTNFTRLESSLPEQYKNESAAKDNTKKSVAFVRANIDEKLYLVPRAVNAPTVVFAQQVIEEDAWTKPKPVLNSAGEVELTLPLKHSIFIPASGEGETIGIFDWKRNYNYITSSWLIDTDKSALDYTSIYALITLPGRIQPTKDSRFRDGPYQLFKPDTFKHFLTMDVVKGVQGFDKPAYQNGPPTNLINCFSQNKQKAAKSLHEKALSQLSYAFPQRIDLMSPSPVFPDFISLPLMSKERCYGPWVATQLYETSSGTTVSRKYKDLGGSVEVIKDEFLAPWNFAGYPNMNEMGKQKAKFSNSLLLLSERGGFVVPSAPSGVTLANELRSTGPLVTNIGVDISTNGIKTTYQLDLYTNSFGKLQKQKEQQLSRASRDRQKSLDEKNGLIRRSAGKNQVDLNYEILRQEIDTKMKELSQLIGATDHTMTSRTDLVASVKSTTVEMFNASTNQKEQVKRTGVDISTQAPDTAQKVGSMFPTQQANQKAYYNAAGGSMSEMYTPVSMEPYHPNMPSKPATKATDAERFHERTAEKTITIYED